MGKLFLVVVDAQSKWLKVLTTKSTMFKSTKAVVCTIFGQYGLPTRLVLDNGTQFTSRKFAHFVRMNENCFPSPTLFALEYKTKHSSIKSSS